MKSKKLTLLLSALMFSVVCNAQRSEEQLRQWQFSHDGTQWENVIVPHDWAISGPFDKKWDLQVVAIRENGETTATEKSGRSGALPWIGKGHYRTKFYLDGKKGHVELLFDGAMSEPFVCVNGEEAGQWKYGYNAFRLDITNLVKAGENTITVDLKNLEESSRWYPGGGIYRPVTLVTTDKAHLDRWGLFFRTLRASKDEATIAVDASVKGLTSNGWRATISLVDTDGNEQCIYNNVIMQDGSVHAVATVKEPHLWSPETPYRYKLHTVLSDAEKAKMLQEVEAQQADFGLQK